MKNYSNLTRRSRLLLLMLFALLAGGVSPAWAETVTDDFTNYAATSSGQTLGDNWYVYPGNDGTYGRFGSDYNYKHNEYDGADANYITGYSSNYTYNVWLVLKKEVSGNVSFRCKMGKNTGIIYVTNKVTDVGDGTFTVDKSEAQSYSISTTTSSNNYNAGNEATYVAFCIASDQLRLLDVTYTEYEEATGPAFVVTEKGLETKLTSPYAYDFGLATAGTTKEFILSNPGAEATPISVNTTGANGFTAVVEGNATSIPAGGEKTLTITMPDATANGSIVVTPTGDGLSAFTFNVSGTVRDTNKEYQSGFTALPSGWTSEGTWNYSAANGASTTAWYLSSNARLKTPMLTVAAGEKFIVEAKGTYSEDESYQHLVLEYSADGTNWTAIGEEVSLTSSFKTFTITTPNEFVAGNYYIALHGSQVAIRMFYGGERISGANFAINTDGSTQDFGSVRVGATAQKTYTITNNGDKNLNITFTADEDFTVSNSNVSRYKLKLTDNFGWGSAYVYAWDKDGIKLLGEWPGTPCAETITNGYGETIFVVTIPDDAVGLIVNNNSGAQTEDITDFTCDGYWMDGTKNDKGHYYVTPVNDGSDPVTMRIAAGESESFTVSMNTASSGKKDGDVVLTFNALNATSFAIPCKGNVKDENYLYVDFEDGQFPTGWQVGADWSFGTKNSNHYACQTSTTTASALVTTPLTVSEDKTLKFKACKNGNGTKSLKVRYSKNGGAEWSDYVSYNSLVESYSTLQETSLTVDNDAEKVIVEFLGCNIQLDDIEGFVKTTAPALALTEDGVAVENNSIKDFGNLNVGQTGTATYLLKNIGNDDLTATITGTDVTVSPSSVSLAGGESATITVTMPYEAGKSNGSVTIDFADGCWISDFTVYYTANLVAPDEFVVDFESGKPAGWYFDTWTVSDGTAHINFGGAKPMITEKFGAEEGKNKLTFDAKMAYNYGTGNQTLNVYTSTDRYTWSETPQTFSLTATSQTFSLDALTDGNYYVKFEAANASIDNVKGVKKLDVPECDIWLKDISGIGGEYTPAKAVSASFEVVNMGTAAQNVSVKAFCRVKDTGDFGEWVSSEVTNVVAGETANIELNGTAPVDEGEYEVYAKVYVGNNEIIQTPTATFTVAHVTSLTMTGFAAVNNNVQADADNNFTAEFNVTVKNTGSTSFTKDQVSVTVTDGDNNDLKTATWTPGETIYLKAGNYTADNANFAIYRWSTDSDSEWALFTGGTDGIYTAELNGKTNFIICRVNPAIALSELSFSNGVWNKSGDLTTTTGVVFENNGYDNGLLKLTQSNNFITGMSATINVSVTAAAGDGGEFEFNAKENVSDAYWYPTLGYKQTVNVTAAATITTTIGGLGYSTFTSNRSLNLNNLPEGLEAFYVKADGVKTNSISLTKAEGKVPAGTGLILKGTPNTQYTLNAANSGIEALSGNLMVGCLTETVLPAGSTNCYVLYADSNNKPMFGYIGTNAATVPAGKAYLKVEGAGARLTIELDDDTTGIMSILSEKGLDGDFYTLEGVRVENLKKGGLYIINGKKVVIK